MTARRTLHPSSGSVWVGHFMDLLLREVVRRWPAAVLAHLKRLAAFKVPADHGMNPGLLGHAVPHPSLVLPDNGKAEKQKQAADQPLLPQRASAAFRAISDRSSSVKAFARALPPLRPRSTAAGATFGRSSSGIASGSSPVAMSKTNFASWFASLGRFGVVMARLSPGPPDCSRTVDFKLRHYPGPSSRLPWQNGELGPEGPPTRCLSRLTATSRGRGANDVALHGLPAPA